jgi:carbonic anhydrase/acetyltransferase-like protein (isoleucine patch superfamily)
MPDLKKQLETFLCRQPRFGSGVFIAQGAVLLGDVTIGDHSSIWCNAVLRADINRIVIGHHSNLQDNVVVHLADEFPCQIGNYVTVGHSAIIHACTIGNETLIGMGATIMDGAVVGEQCIVGAQALIVEGEQIPPGSLVLGSPGRVVRGLTAEERESLPGFAKKYVELAAFYLERGIGSDASGRPAQH